ncbi:MAG: arsenic transporter [Erysipelotrichaceae bacterium]|nr:arsenic transporter [Erysipelotrichaceae bacterium]
MKELALILFLSTYACLLIFPKYRTYVALGSASLFVLVGIMPIANVFPAIDFNVLMMIGGTMGIVYLFIESKMPALLADIILDKTPNVQWAIVSLALFAGIISAFVDNVATVLMVAPVAMTIAKKLKINPVNAIIAIAVSSNLQGAATLVGDTTSILLGGAANMNFLDFFFYQNKIGMFWVVEVSALASMFMLLWLFRKEKKRIELEEKQKVTDFFPTFLLVSMVVLLVLASLFPISNELIATHINGIICMILLMIGLLYELLFNKKASNVVTAIKEIDYQTLLLLAGLFVVIGAIKQAGLITDIGNLFAQVSGGNLFVVYTLIVWVSVFLSAFIDNIPYVATMLPVVAALATSLNIPPTILYFGLLCGATLGGNLTPIGASANIAGLGILRKEGYEVSAKQFMSIGVPFTLIAVLTGYVMIWLIWA